MARRSKFSDEVRERAVRMVREHGPEHASRWEAIRSIAGKIGCSAEALRIWVRRAEIDAGRASGENRGPWPQGGRSLGDHGAPARGWFSTR